MTKVVPGKALIPLFLAIFSIGIIAPRAMANMFNKPAMAYMYGEEQPTTQLIVDKKVKTTAVSEWQDNLPASQIVLKEGDIIEFEIAVKNTGDEELKNINVIDYLPSYLKFIFGSDDFNEDEKEVKWQIEKLAAGEEKFFKIRAQIDNLQLTSDGTFCLINKARATAESGESDEDTASFCLVSTKKLPKAGAGSLAVGTLAATLIATAGVALRKFGRGEILA